MKRLHISQPAIQSQKKSGIQRGDQPAAVLSLEEVRTRFETWRRAKKPHNRIPKSLWAAAVEVCKQHPTYQVSQALRLNYTELKQRTAQANSGSDTQHPFLDSNFVELSLGLEAQPVLCSIELESPKGGKVKMSFTGKCRDLDPMALAKLFWGVFQ